MYRLPNITLGVAVVLLGVVLSGCMAPHNTSVQDVRVPILDLVYDSPTGERMTFHLGEARSIQSANGVRLDAYPLVAREAEGGQLKYVAWLDANLLLVRMDTACWARGSPECTHQSLTWRLEGLPWILGLDTGLSLDSENRTGYSSWGHPIDALPTLRHTKTHVVASFSSRGAEDAPRIPFSGDLTFARGSVYPERVQVHLGDATVRTELDLVSANVASRREPVQAVTDHLAVNTVTVAAPGHLFIDESDDTFGIGHSHTSLLNAFFAEFPDARKMIDSGGCLIGYILRPTEVEGVLATLDQHEIASMQLRILGNDGHGKRWRVDVNDGPWGVSFSVKEEDAFSKEWTCEQVETPDLPALSVQEFLARASSRVVTHIGLHEVQVAREPMPGPGTGTAVFGTRFMAYFEPEAGKQIPGGGVRKSPYFFAMHAEAERMLFVEVHPSDVGNFAS